MAHVTIRQPQTGQAYSGDAADPVAYAQKIANALQMYVEYCTDTVLKKTSTWIEVYPSTGLPPMMGG